MQVTDCIAFAIKTPKAFYKFWQSYLASVQMDYFLSTDGYVGFLARASGKRQADGN